MAKRDFKYLALSHMWGDPNLNQHLKLLTSNIAEFQKAVPWASLSSVYKEAVRVTLALGYNYLWVDSLCILQDKDHPDWKHEAPLMSTVYGNADCNLAFLFPSFSNDNAHTRSDPRDWNPCILREATPGRCGVSIQHLTSAMRQAYQSTEDKDWLIQRNWPLFSRAWTFQEYLLSPRTLLLGHKNLMFHCSHHFYDELLGPIASPPLAADDTTPKQGRDYGKTRYFPPSLAQGMAQDVVISSPRALSFAIDWQALFNEYRSRELTKPNDRVIAFAGIARAFSNIGSMTYLAGCWAEYFALTMLWYVDRKREATVRRDGPSVRRGGIVEYPVHIREEVEQEAPSWSQFSVPIYTHHQPFFMFNNDEIFLRSKSCEKPPRVWWDDIYWTDLVSVGFGSRSQNGFPESGFFDFRGLEVDLSMPLLPVKTSWLKDLEQRFANIRKLDRADARLQWVPDFTYYPDKPHEDGSREPSPPSNGVLALVAEFQICRPAGQYLVQRRSAGLVLVRVPERGAWKRVGAWKLSIKICGVDVDSENAGDVARRWKKYRTWEVGRHWTMENVAMV